MSLQTRRPLGHAKRKALTYATDIAALRAQGYTYAAIREALGDVGVAVSISTVRREATRAPSTWKGLDHMRAAGSPHVAESTSPTPPATATSLTVAAPAMVSKALPGRDIAEAFVRGRPTNSLFLKEP